MPSFGGLGRDLFALHLVTLELLLAFRFAKHIRRIFLLVGLAHCFLSCPSAVPPSLKLDKLLPPPLNYPTPLLTPCSCLRPFT